MSGTETPSPSEQPGSIESAPSEPSAAEQIAFTPANHADHIDEGDEDAANVQVLPPEAKVTNDNSLKAIDKSPPLKNEAAEQQEISVPMSPLAEKAVEAVLPQPAKEVSHTDRVSVEESDIPRPEENEHTAEETAQAKETTDAPTAEEVPIEETAEDGDNKEPSAEPSEATPEAKDEGGDKDETETETTNEQPPSENEDDKKKVDHAPSTSFRVMGEGDRAPEFKAARDTLATDVNGWTSNIAKSRDEATPLSDGTVIRDTPRITNTDMGPINAHAHASVEERQPGVSVTGDGIQEPIRVQAVRANEAGTTEIIEITGSDPLDIVLYGDEYSFDRKSTVASFSVRDVSQGQERSFGFSITGQGAMQRHFIDERGVHRTEPLRDEVEIAMATQAFGQIIESLM